MVATMNIARAFAYFHKSHQGGPSLRAEESTMTGKAIVFDHTQRTWLSETR